MVGLLEFDKTIYKIAFFLIATIIGKFS